MSPWLAGGLMAGTVVAGCGGGSHQKKTASDPSVTSARSAVGRALSSVAGYRGPTSGPRAQPGSLVMFVAADLTNGGIAGVARGVQQAARARW